MTRILGQAETWYEEFGDLLLRCGIAVPSTPPQTQAPNRLATSEEVKAAVDSAESNVSLDLDEARALRVLGERIQKWQDEVALAAPKRSKRVGKGKREDSRYTVDDLIALIDESTRLPIKTDDDAERLRQQLHNVHEWRLMAQRELGNIATSFRALRQAAITDYGLPDEFYDESTRESGSGSTEVVKGSQDPQSTGSVSDQIQDSPPGALVTDKSLVAQAVNQTVPSQAANVAGEAILSADDSSQTDTSSQAESDNGMEGGRNAVCRMISSLLKSAKLTGIRTTEEEVTELLDKSAKWILRSLKCIDSPKDVYDKKYFRLFDEFISTGEELLIYRDSLQDLKLDDAELLQILGTSSGDLVADQLVRLKILQTHRNKFIAWFKNAEKVLSSKEERVTFEVLSELAEQSHDYPASKFLMRMDQSVSCAFISLY